jgi:lysophospholipase L1-like esterase
MMFKKTKVCGAILGLVWVLGLGSARADSPDTFAFKNGDRVAFLGDSITKFGWVHPAGWIQLVDRALQEQYVNIEVIPAGISGNKSPQMLARLDADVLSKDPDWLVLSCGVNDVWHKTGVSLEDYRTNITAIVEQAQTKGVRVLILTATMIYEEPDKPQNRKLAGYNEFLRELAAEKGCLLADLNADMQALVAEHREQLGEKPYFNLLTGDGVHMNAAGDVMMASGILRAIGFDETQLANARAMWTGLDARMHNRFPMKLSDQLLIDALNPEERREFNARVDNLTGPVMSRVIREMKRDTPPDALKPFRIYTTGNSLIEQTMFGPGWKKLAEWMAANENIALEVAKDHTGGTSLDYRFMQFAARHAILGEADRYRCDAFVMQPYATYNGLGTYARSDLLAAQRYVDLVASQSPEAPVYLYVLYPRMEQHANFDEGWNLEFNFKDQSQANWILTSQSKSYFDGLLADLKAYTAQEGYTNPIRLIPVGHVMERLHRMMKAGEIPGFTDVWQLHKDGVHHNALGGWMDTLTFYAVIFGEDPAVLPFDLVDRRQLEDMVAKDERIADMAQVEAAEKIIKRVVWETVCGMAVTTGVRKYESKKQE